MRHRLTRRAALLLAVMLPATAAQANDRTKIWNANKQTVVKLKVSGRDAGGSSVPVRTGSGVLVRSNGTIVTALHVVGRDEEWFEEGGRRARKVEVIGLDEHGIEDPLGLASVTPVPTLDTAILHITATGLSAATIADERPDELASVVAILWDPDSSQPQPVAADLVPTDRGRYGDVLTVQMAVMPGHSGSGLFDTAGNLIGVITNQLSTTGALAIPSDRFSQFLPGP
jgi:S1-C subfamily serine protease